LAAAALVVDGLGEFQLARTVEAALVVFALVHQL
jgi:hypothetical protein